MNTTIELVNTKRESNAPPTSDDTTKRASVLHWDGRLDNVQDLLPVLADLLCGDTGNSAIALAAYQRWGIDGLMQLIGDWSIVIRDDAERTTILASDYAGVRPLYYSVKMGHVVWSSRLQSVVETTVISDLDEEYMGAFLLFGGCPNRTAYKGIYSVPPGHAVCVSPMGTKIRRFWTAPVRDEVRYRNHSRYEERLRALLREAVSTRLQTEAPVLAELSGGLDSSSVVAVANHLIRSGAVPATSLTTVSYVWQNSLDESFIREMESFCGVKGFHISTDAAPVISETDAGDIHPELLRPLRRSVASLSHQLGAKVLLTGMNGDLMMGNWFDDSLQVSAYLRRFQWGRGCKEAFQWSKILRLPIYRILWQAISATVRSATPGLADYMESDGAYAPKNTETSLVPAFIKQTGISESSNFFSSDWAQAQPERRKYFRALSTMLELRVLQVPEAWQHLDYTHPFAHRPLVEFLMTVPLEVLCGPAEPRKLMRKALADMWPAKLRMRRSKALFDRPFHEALRPIALFLTKSGNFQVVERGFVNRVSLVSRLQRLCNGLDANEAQLRYVIALELWLRNQAGARTLR